jgi:hypothetical protein
MPSALFFTAMNGVACRAPGHSSEFEDYNV